VSELGDFAAKLEAAAARMNQRLAADVVKAQAEVFLRIEKRLTPVRSGKLQGSERIDSRSGGGSHAVAVISPHTKYAQFREDGGTITKHSPGSLGNPAVGFFGHSVTQKGSHYVADAEAAAAGVMPAIAEQIVDGYLS